MTAPEPAPLPARPLLSILSDQPASEDQLNFAPYAKTLAQIIADPHADTPLTIGVFGGWGQGKTSLMRMVQRQLVNAANPDFAVRAVWFNAWLYSQQPALWRALISQVLRGVRNFPSLHDEAKAELSQIEARLYGVSPASGGHLTLPAGALPGLKDAALPPLLGLELLRRQAQRAGKTDIVARLATLMADLEESEALTRHDQMAALDDFRREFERISRQYIVDHGRLAVFIDDLDRCLPDKAVEVLEAVKLFLDVPGCVFVLGVAREVIEEGIRVRYQDYAAHLDGAQYLEKIIQIPFALPPIAPEAVAGYVQQVTGGSLPDPRCETVFAVGLEANPRRLKRTLNIFLLLWRLAQNRPDLAQIIKPVRLAKIVIIQQYYPALFSLITAGPHYLCDLEQRFRQQDSRSGDTPKEAALPQEQGLGAGSGTETISAGPLSEFLGKSLLRALLSCTGPTEPEANFADIGPAGVREYVYLTRNTVEEPAAAKTAETALPFEPQLVTIPAGPFLMGTPESDSKELEKLGLKREVIDRETPQHEVSLPAYAMGRYPVTNAEFARFIEDGGYATRDFWSEAGWKQRESDGWAAPRYWEDSRWNDPAQPVVGVSWYEAQAYCHWLAAKTGRPYRLPSEAEWEKAARGPDGRRYPWGNEWDKSRCNNKDSGPSQTTPVGQYSPAGDSPYGVGDMAGQVWEWCSSKYGGYEDKPNFGYPYRLDDGREDLEGDDTRILRGGSWYSDNPAAVCRCGSRDRSHPRDGSNYWGFRCARSLSS
jgi:formylglycine-generating enzyme required for sulfatase activity